MNLRGLKRKERNSSKLFMQAQREAVKENFSSPSAPVAERIAQTKARPYFNKMSGSE
jgi:hypothetical protein